ncbi:MAG: MarC family protein [Paracoccus sp. (in: a-proteobacteria)]
MDQAFFITTLGGAFAIMNPFVVLPLFLAVTHGMEPGPQRRAGLRVAGFSAVLCAVVAVSGAAVLKFFGISVDDFRVAGGLVLMSIAMSMLSGSGSPAHEAPAKAQAMAVQEPPRADVSFYPLAFPMVVGPGTITAIIVFMGQAGTMADKIAVAAAFGLVLAVLALVLFFAATIGRHMSQTLRVIMTRLMGMIVAAIGIQMIGAGLKAILPGLAG